MTTYVKVSALMVASSVVVTKLCMCWASIRYILRTFTQYPVNYATGATPARRTDIDQSTEQLASTTARLANTVIATKQSSCALIVWQSAHGVRRQLYTRTQTRRIAHQKGRRQVRYKHKN